MMPTGVGYKLKMNSSIIFRRGHKYHAVNKFKEELHLKPKLNMSCALSESYQHWFEKWYNHSESKVSAKLKTGINIVGQLVLELLTKFCMF